MIDKKICGNVEIVGKHFKNEIVDDAYGMEKKRLLLLFILLLPFTEPYIFKEYETADTVFAIVKSLAFLVIFYLYCKRKPSKTILLICALCGWMGLSTIIRSGSFVAFIGPAVGLYSTFALFELAADVNLTRFARWVRNLLTVYCVVNFLTWLAGDVWSDRFTVTFLGIDNRWIYYFLPWITLSFLVPLVNEGKASKVSWLVWSCCVLQLLAVWSIGALASIALWPVFWFLFQFCRRNGRVIIQNIHWIFWIVVVINILLTTGYLISNFIWLIEGILHKDRYLAGRVFLWDAVYDMLKEHPLTGAGVQSSDVTMDYFYTASGYVPGCEVNHPHNNFLYYAFKGGFPALIMYGLLYWGSLHHLEMEINSVVSRCLVCAIVVYSVAALADSLDFSMMHMIFALALNVEKFNEEAERKNVFGSLGLKNGVHYA